MPMLKAAIISISPALRGSRKAPEDPFGDRDRVELVGHLVEEDRELVAAEAGHRVAGPDALLEPAGDGQQEGVSGGMTERVVDVLEVVEVEEEDGEVAAVVAVAGDARRHPLLEQRAVGQRRQLVVVRLVAERRLELLSLGDVAGVEHHGSDVGVRELVAQDRLHVAVGAVGVAPARAQQLLPVIGSQQLLEDPVGLREVVGVEHPPEGRVEQDPGAVAEELFDRRGYVGDPSVGVEQGDDVGGVLDQRPEAGLAGFQVVGRLAQVLGKVDPLERERDARAEAGKAVRNARRECLFRRHREEAAELSLDCQGHRRGPAAEGDLLA